MVMRLYSTAEHMGLTIKADLPDNDLSIDTLIGVFPGANWHEREAWEMFGIGFNGPSRPPQHLPARRVRGQPPPQGLPAAGPAGEAVARHRGRGAVPRRGGPMTAVGVDERQQLAYVATQAADARLNVEIETEGMTLNIGPQHPATHGTLRLVARLDGEQVVEAEPIMGYMHRGYEKLAEVRTYPQVTTLINRIDWLGSFANEVPFILAAEKLMEVEAPPRAQWIRTALFELSRIANITLFLGDMAVQLGALTPVFMAFRDREFVLQPDRSGYRRSVPPQLRPHRRRQRRPPQRLDRRHQAGHGEDP